MKKVHHAYHQALTGKLFLKKKTSPKAELMPEEVVTTLRRIQHLSRGMPTICYLVGWQYEGHDSKYPAWHAVSPGWKRACDATARDSFHWVVREAKTLNTVVSVHANMCDAYEDSPLWDTYVKEDLLIRETNGALKKGGVWDGQQSYLVCKRREWDSGRAKERLDALLELLPIQEAGTVHFDVFQPLASPFHGVTVEDDAEAMRSIIGYLRSKGVDVTKEWHHHEVPVPWAVHFNLDEVSRLRIPANQVCGCGSSWNVRVDPANHKTWFSNKPEPGCRFPDAWGDATCATEGVALRDKEHLSGFHDGFCLGTLPWYLLNRQRPVEHRVTRDLYTVRFDKGAFSEVDIATGKLTQTQDGRVIRVGTDVCAPVLWRKGHELMAYSRTGGRRRWQLPKDWPRVNAVTVAEIGLDGLGPARTVAVKERAFSLSMPAGRALCVQPAAFAKKS